MKRFFSLLAAAGVLLTAAPAHAQTLSIAAAADLAFCLETLDAEFVKTHPGADLKVSTGSSGNFATQIQNGAPFDVFLSADLSYPQTLIKAGLADPASLTPYAVGRLVLWTTKPGLEVARGLEILRDPAVKKIAIANPEHAPYGRAAKAALEHFQLLDVVKDRLVLGENIAQTAQFVQTGNADAGLVALSLVVAPKLAGVGRYQELPLASYPRLEQGVVITKKGTSNPLAAQYLEFLRSAEARTIFDQFGFTLPREK